MFETLNKLNKILLKILDPRISKIKKLNLVKILKMD